MTTGRRTRSAGPAPSRQLAGLRIRLAESEETLRALRTGDVDTVVVPGRRGPQVFTLQGAEQAYRVLIECMNEGALTLTRDKTILYANQCFATMVKSPLEQVTGGSFRRYLSAADTAKLRSLIRRAGRAGRAGRAASKLQVLLHRADDSWMPAQISIRSLAQSGLGRAAVGMVVTDMTEVRRNEEMLRALTGRVVEVQEAERGRVALELHDDVTQLLCAVLVRSQALAVSLSGTSGPAEEEALRLRDMLGRAAREVERISRGLRPGVLDQLGLVAVVRSAGTAFAERTGVTVRMACVELTARLPADAELALYRILQEALTNAEQHARAGRVTVRLTQHRAFVQLSVTDDGVGFDPDRRRARPKTKRGLGLLGMRERSAYVGGDLEVRSAPGDGTTIRARVPFANDGTGRLLTEASK